jgi:type I restriction enzyme S subunit
MVNYGKIGETCLVGDGTHSKIGRHDSGVLYLTSRNFKDGCLDLSKVYYISQDDYAKHFLSESKALACPRPMDLVFSIIGTIGEPYLVRNTDQWGISSSVAIVRPNRTVIDPAFLLYWFKGPMFQSALFGIKGGVAQGYVSLEMIRSLPVPLFPLPVQQRIAAILSAYDELIENSQRRIKILEAMARSLYREWFVHFRFPGHENHSRVASALGEIPEGWSIKRLDDVAVVTMGLSPNGDTYNEDGIGTPLVNGPVEFGERFTKAVKWTTAPSKLCNDGDLVVCVRGSTTGKFVKSNGVYCLGRGVCSMSSKYQGFIDMLFEYELPKLLAQTSGSTFPSWTGPQLKGHLIVCPSSGVLSGFDSFIKPMSDEIKVLSQKVENLRRTRDLLLPRLLSGQIEVEDV